MSEKKYVITISRQFGSLGRPIAKKLAEQVVREITIHPEKAAEVIAAGMKKYEETRAR